MSIEDPRLSMIDNTSAADEFDSAVEQHLGFASETVGGIEVAQAEAPDAGRTDRLPAQQPVNVAAAVIPSEVTPDNENVVTLPAGIELDNLEFQVDGENLVLVLADGTEITVIGGAANIPTFVIGDVELPQVALFAALEESNINVAAGPDGTFSALSSPEASRNFVDNEIDAGPEDFALADLLGDTSFGDEVNSAVIFGGNGRPSITTPLTESFIYDEVVLADGVAGNQIISGRLPFNAGPDFGTITRVDFTGASNVDEEGLGPQVLAGFTSGGRPITVVSFTAPTDGAVLDFVAVEGRDSEGNLVFTLTITNRVTGDFTFELVGQLDHPDAGQNGSQDDLDDLLRLGFTYTVTDRDGDSVTGSFNIDVMDDAPEIIAGAQPISITVDEDDIDTPTSQGTAPNDGNVPDGSYTGTPGVNNGGPANATSTGSLAGLVNVGADKNLSFSLISIDAARTYLEGLGLKSNGLPLGFDLSQDGTIIGFVNSQAPGQAVPGEEYNVGADRLVFEFKLNPNGTFSFSLHDQIDHAPGAGQNTLTIDFGSVLQANDGDGDSVTLTGLVNVNVTDDVPVIATGAKPITITVDEDDIDTSTSKGNAPNDGNNPDGSYTGTPGVNTGGPANATSTGSLLSLVKVGADENVSFSLISIADARTYLEGLGLKSNGLPLGFDLSANGTIIGFVNSQAPGQASPGQEYNVGDDRLVFEFKLNPNGTFTFSLSDQLDHALGNGENTLTIDFGSVLQATDNDGDSVALTGLVKVNVTDDVPVIAPNATPITIKVDEDDIDTATSLGNAPNDGNNPDGSFTGTPGVDTRGPANATSTVSLSSLVKVGADESVSFSLINQAAMRTYLESLKLTSNGAQIGYDLRTDGTIIAFVNAPGGQVPGQTFDNGDRLVFEFKLNPNGTFTFSLSDQLDHPAGNGQNTLTIDFGSVLQATDNDGDSIKLTGLVKVDVTDDVPVIAPNATPITIKVDEDDIDTATSLGTSPNDGNVLDGSYTGTPSANTAGPANATSTGNLSSLVKVGADENVSFSLISTAAMRTYLENLKLTSNGAQIGYDLRTDGTIIAFVNAPGGQVPGQTFDNGDRLVFEFKLNPNGTFTFSLSDQLDHPAGNGQNTLTIDFGAVLQATDNDGDSVKLTGLVKVDVTDDVPELSGKTEARTVDEDDIKTSQSTGTSPADGNGDGSYTGGPNQGGNGPAFIDGSLAYLVKGGADDTVKFEFISEAALRLSLEGLGLSSKGEVLSYDLQGNVLWGFANVGAPGVSYDPNLGDRPVFKLTLNTNGSYTFELIDQLDHVKPAAGGSDENFALKPGVLAIDFGTVIKVTDFDGDSITLGKTFSIAIKDDVPELTGKTEARTVDEDDIRTSQSLGTSPADYDADGSWTGGPGQGGNGGAFIDGSLAYLVKGGADDAVKFSFSDDAASVLQGLGLKSKGELLSYEVKGNVLYAYDNKDGAAGYGANDRVVFKLTLNANGAYSFELIDQLDHVKPDAGADENFPLQPSGLLAINFGSVIEAKDFDGDSIKLGSAFSIEVRDDVPVHTGEVEKISLDAPQLVETTVGKVANFVLVLDTSGSVTVADIKAQVTGFLNSLANSDAEDVRVHIVRFAGDAAPVGTFDLIQDGAIVGSQLNAALTAIGQLPGGGATNYEAGLQQALQWIEGVPSQTISVDRTITSFDANTNGGNGQGNNDTAYIIGNGTTQIALVSGWRDPGTATGQLESVVGNTNNGWGVIDGDVDSGEILRFDFGAFNDFDGANGAYANVGNFSGVAVTSAQFTLDDNRWGGSTNFGYTVYFVGGGTQAAVINVNNDNTPLTITGTGPNLGKQIAYIEFTIPSGNGYGDVDLQSVVTAPIAPGTLENADVNQLIFLSDGQPNATQSGSTNATNALQAIIDEITKIESDSDGAGRDQKFTIEAYGVRANEAGLGNLAQVEGPGGGSTNVTSDRNLTSAMKDVLDSLVETTVTGQSVSATFDVNDLVAVGADDDITFSLGTNTSGLPQQLGGINLIYSFEAGLLVAKSGGATVFTLALSTDGKGTFTLYKPLGQADVNIDFSSIVQATDFDGDSIALATGKFVVTVVAPNVAPETQDVATTGNEDTVIPVQLSGSDANGTVAGFVIKTLPGNGGLFKDAAATEAVAIGDTVSGPVYFKPNADYNGPASFTFAAKDNLGLEDATPATASITVNPVNDAPTTDNRSATGDEDTTITVNLAGAGADIDGTVVGYVIKSLPQNGTLYLNSNGTGAVAIGQTVTGSVYFKPNADYNGPASFTFAAIDNLGLEDESPATASITVNPVNDAPVLSYVGGTLAYVEGDGPRVVDTDLTVADVDNATLASATVQITGGYQSGQDVLNFINNNSTDFGNITASYDAGNGRLTLTSAGATATKAQFEAALEAVTYENTSENPTTANRTISYSVNDGNLTSNIGQVTVTVAAVNDAPVLSDVGGTISFTEGDLAKVIDGEITITDVDDVNMEGATVIISSGFAAGQDVLLFNAQNGISGNYNAATGVLTLSGTATKAQYELALESVRYQNTSENPSTSARTVSFAVSDGEATSNLGTATINVNGDTIITNAGIGTQFSVANWALLSNDTDVESNALSVNSVGGQSDLNASLSGGNVNITDTGNAGGSFTYQASDGQAQSGNATVQVQQDTAGSLDGSGGRDILVAVAKPVGQVTKITFASSYDVGDVVSITVDGTTYSHTVVNGGTSAEAVYDALKGTIVGGVSLANRLTSKGVSWPADLTLNAVTLAGAPGAANSFTVSANTGNTNDVGLRRYSVNFDDTIWTFQPSGTIEVYVNGVLYFGNSSSGNLSAGARFDAAASDLLSKLTAAGFNASYNTSSNTFLIDAATNTTVTGRYQSQPNTAWTNVTATSTSLSNPTDQPAPTVNTTQVAADGGITVNGNGGDDIIFGSAAGDVISGGAGKDILTGGLGGDTFVWSEGTSNIAANADVIRDYNIGQNDKIDLTNLGLTISNIKLITDGGNLLVQAFVAGTWQTVYTLEAAATAGTDYALIKLGANTFKIGEGVAAVAAADPIILDLDRNGFDLSSIGAGVMFDINADGHKDQMGWTSKDGILALDLDGNGLIDNGSEIFTPDFNGGKFASGVAALASLDTNGDGKIDANDDAFSKLKIWVDANNNGISDEGELSSLFDNGVTSISLTTDNTGGQEDGQTVFSKGTFTFADGSTGDFMEVGFDTIFGSDADPLTVMGTDGDDILHGGMGQVVMTGGAGNDTFVFDGTALDELDVADVITDFNGDGDVLDVTALLDSLLGEQASAETAASHLRATVEDGNTTVSVQTGADTWKDVVVLQNHDTAIKVLFDDKHAVVTPHD